MLSSSQRQPASESTSTSGEVSLTTIQAFHWLDEAHSRYVGEFALRNVQQLEC